jgi:hypothetical protein
MPGVGVWKALFVWVSLCGKLEPSVWADDPTAVPQLRRASGEETEAWLQREAAFLEWARASGAMATLVAGCMVQALERVDTEPTLLLDDVAGFRPGEGDGRLRFFGQQVLFGDLRSLQLPGKEDCSL